MAKALGLTRRGGAYQVRIGVPEELRAAYGGREDFRISLGVVDKPTAQLRAHRLRAEKEAEFASQRCLLNPPAIEHITPALVNAVGAQVYMMVLRMDDDARELPEVKAALGELATLTVPGSALTLSKAPSEERSMLEARALEGLNSSADMSAAIALARRHLISVQPLAQKATAAVGVSIDWSTPGARDVLRRSLEEYRRARADCSRRDAGDLIPTPVEVVRGVDAQPLTTHRMVEVFDVWKASGDNPSAATIRKKKASLAFYAKFSKDAPIESLTTGLGVEFTAYLLGVCVMQKTAKDHLDGVKSLLNFARDKLGWLKANPWENHSVKVKLRNQRRPWPVEDLRRLVDSDLFKSYTLPQAMTAGGAAAYWVPLLGLYTGARQSELCQIRVGDLEDSPEGLSLSLMSDSGDADDGTPGTTLKTESSNRRIPVHPDLVSLGFKDYWLDMKAKGNKVIFPDIKRVVDKAAGEYFSDWFLTYRRQQGIKKRWVDFHALRHTAASRLTDAGIPDSVADYLTGHSGGGRGSARNYKAMQEIRPAMELLKYPELNLVRVYFPD
ncbi:MAG: site-specific integrase [Aquabacterium sp.]|nr:site-specific integrase [Aquabacterium sp.]